MKNYNKQQGASTPLVILFFAMAMIILTIAFKLYPAFYEHWQVTHVLEGFEEERDLPDLSANEIKTRFGKRLLTNNIRNFDSTENLTVTKQDGVITMYIEYEVRIPIYENIDAIVSFEESLEKQF
jgi:hypothetical protein